MKKALAWIRKSIRKATTWMWRGTALLAWLRLWWQKIKQHPIRLTFVGIACVIGIALLIGGYFFNWTWTGFGPYVSPQTSGFQRGKTLYDWLQLAIIPAAIAFGVWSLNRLQQKRDQQLADERAIVEREAAEKRAQTERDIALDNQREEALQDYIDSMSELLLEKNLLKSLPEYEVRRVARVRTLTVLPRLDGWRKRSVLLFLHESGLIEKGKCIVDLSGADLSYADLSGANLSEANLSGANLNFANLVSTDLRRANLRRANLVSAKLNGANLHLADLSGAKLNGAKLNGADLDSANLRGANLHLADLRRAVLSQATLRGASLYKADLSGAFLKEADLSSANLTDTNATPEQFTGARNVTPEQLAQIKPPQPAVPQEAKTEQASATPAPSERKPDQTSQEEVEQQNHTPPKQGTDAVH